MRFKTSAKKIMCIRTTYVPGADGVPGRGVDKTIVSVDLWSTSVPEDVKDLLDEAEQQQLQAFLDERQQRSEKLMTGYALEKLAKNLETATKALDNPEILGRELTQAEIVAIWRGLDAMRLKMKRAGYLRPKTSAGEGGK
ncbi:MULTISPECIES: hypothetical protein [Pseudomonas]|uniref:Uncharacterized protein n=1 Tax=Pseudomonas juntendi TaxID=2666183 RepID=A0AAJ5SDW9_9PSED|nr:MULTISPECIES: hypothetical protein [Pseudomonas]MBA1205364.1 hypothetical protein [Pseudomonas capeferrum]WEA23726.1 hypothetical protein PWA60_28620 [Pseudomonas juntendi]